MTDPAPAWLEQIYDDFTALITAVEGPASRNDSNVLAREILVTVLGDTPPDTLPPEARERFVTLLLTVAYLAHGAIATAASQTAEAVAAKVGIEPEQVPSQLEATRANIYTKTRPFLARFHAEVDTDE